ncbi:hypothetical protein HUJ05_010728 [Dendroctonus ponderosae]|nr:hypothetical protein HUJ05_010728 [Dendroctonus ponderosae]
MDSKKKINGTRMPIMYACPICGAKPVLALSMVLISHLLLGMKIVKYNNPRLAITRQLVVV